MPGLPEQLDQSICGGTGSPRDHQRAKTPHRGAHRCNKPRRAHPLSPRTTEIYTLSLHDALPISTQLPYILAISRFAHYMKAMMRDKIGSFMSRKECQDFLNNWINQYVAVGEVGATIKAQKPLSEARIDVTSPEEPTP